MSTIDQIPAQSGGSRGGRGQRSSRVRAAFQSVSDLIAHSGRVAAAAVICVRARRSTGSGWLGSAAGLVVVGGLAWGDEAGLVGVDHYLDAVAEAEFLQDAGDMCLGGCFADHQLLADLGVGQAAGEQVEDFAF